MIYLVTQFSEAIVQQPSGNVLRWLYTEEAYSRKLSGFFSLKYSVPPERRHLQQGKQSSLDIVVAWMKYPRRLSDYLCSDAVHIKESSDDEFSSSGSLM